MFAKKSRRELIPPTTPILNSIVAKTLKAHGVPSLEDTSESHYASLSDDDYEYFMLKPGASVYIPMKYEWPNKETYSKSGEYYVATQTVSVDWMQAVGN